MKIALTNKILCTTLVLAFSLSACGNSPSDSEVSPESVTVDVNKPSESEIQAASQNVNSKQAQEVAEKLLDADTKEANAEVEAVKIAANLTGSTEATSSTTKTPTATTGNSQQVTAQSIFKGSDYIGLTELPSGVKKYQLQLRSSAFIDKRFVEPSGLAFDDKGALYTITDKLHHTIYKLTKFGDTYKMDESIDMNYSQILKLRLKKKNKFDFEGIVFYNNAFYLADERDRKVERVDREGNITDLNIDTNAYMKANGIKNDVSNSGFEGLTIDPVNKLMYLIKERQESTIFVVDMNTNKIIRHFKVMLAGNVEPALTDASFFEGNLYVLVRSHRLILKINPANGELLSTYDYRRYEEDPKHVYVKIPTIGSGNDPEGYGVMEGLAVTKDSFYVATDNNMLPLKSSLLNNKPQIFTFARPE